MYPSGRVAIGVEAILGSLSFSSCKSLKELHILDAGRPRVYLLSPLVRVNTWGYVVGLSCNNFGKEFVYEAGACVSYYAEHTVIVVMKAIICNVPVYISVNQYYCSSLWVLR